MLDVGQTVDRYTVESIIGYGGTAVVYLVKHNQLETVHALKVLSVSSGAIRERMLREGRVQAALTHPNVVAVSDVLDVDGSPGLLMEYIEGPSLEDALKEFRISLDDAETLFRGIVMGVHAAHETGLVHRDLKPANVLLCQTNEGFVPKVTDFGLAKVLVGDGLEVGTTRAGIAMGTPSYMSPEQIRDARQVDQRADVFSLGCLLYELVTGQRAFPGEQALTIYNAITGGEYLPAEQLVQDLPKRVVQCIDGCLAQDRDERIPDCSSVLEVLSGQLEWMVSPHPVPTEAIVERFEDDIPLMQVAGPFLDDDLTAGEPIGVAISEEVPPAPEMPIARERSSPWKWIAGITAVVAVMALLCGLPFTLGQFTSTQSATKSSEASPASSVSTSSDVTEASTAPTPPVATTPQESASASTMPNNTASQKTTASTPQAPKAASNPVIKAPVPNERIVPKVVKPKPTPPKKPRAKASPPVVVKLLSVPPNAALFVDGKDSGRTNKKLELSPGSHAITMKSGEKESNFKIKVSSGGTNKWCYAFADEKLVNASCPRP